MIEISGYKAIKPNFIYSRHESFAKNNQEKYLLLEKYTLPHRGGLIEVTKKAAAKLWNDFIMEKTRLLSRNISKLENYLMQLPDSEIVEFIEGKNIFQNYKPSKILKSTHVQVTSGRSISNNIGVDAILPQQLNWILSMSLVNGALPATNEFRSALSDNSGKSKLIKLIEYDKEINGLTIKLKGSGEEYIEKFEAIYSSLKGKLNLLQDSTDNFTREIAELFMEKYKNDFLNNSGTDSRIINN